jgi:hypothetical protein
VIHHGTHRLQGAIMPPHIANGSFGIVSLDLIHETGAKYA